MDENLKNEPVWLITYNDGSTEEFPDCKLEFAIDYADYHKQIVKVELIDKNENETEEQIIN